MYSGMIIFSRYSGRIFGTHQKIDRLARDDLNQLLKGRKAKFPSAKSIIHFEGINGPDGIKRKSPAKDEPWHYINPFDAKDTGILKAIAGHYDGLVAALKEKNDVRASFEAAWLSHAIVDGLTPAHHYPYESKLAALRGGEGRETRTTIKKKLIMPGETVGKRVSNNWKMWGPRGLYTSHMSFEMGVTALIAPMTFKKVLPNGSEIQAMNDLGVEEWFQGLAKEVAALDLFDRFIKRGWTAGLAREVKRTLLPTMIKAVTVAWFCAMRDAGLIEKAKK